MAGRVEGKVALVTGGSLGIGKSAALLFAREGAKVVVVDVDTPHGDETVREIREAGGDAIFVHGDVSKAPDVEAMVAKTVEVYGRLDCAYNNAGISGKITPMHEYSEEAWDEVLNVNLKGTWLCMKYEIPQMLKQGGGSIVNTSAAAGLVAPPFPLSPYSASKHGIIGLTRAGASEYGKQGIRVNVVCPASTRTAMTQGVVESIGRDPASATLVGRLGVPEETAEAVVWLCSDAASFVTGHPLSVDGGFVAH